MNQKQLIEFFQEMEDMDDPETLDDLESAVRETDGGTEVVLDNLEQGRCAHKSMAIALRFQIKEAVPLLQPYLNSQQTGLRRQAEIVLAKLK